MIEDVDKWESDMQSQIAANFPESKGPAVVALRETQGPSLDSIPVIAPRKTIAVDPNVVCEVKLNSEWVSDDWDKVAAYAIHRMTYEQYMQMMQRVEKIAEKVRKDSPNWDDVTVICRAFSTWAEETYNK